MDGADQSYKLGRSLVPKKNEVGSPDLVMHRSKDVMNVTRDILANDKNYRYEMHSW